MCCVVHCMDVYAHVLCCTLGIGVCIVLCCTLGVGVCIVRCCTPCVDVRVVHCVYVYVIEEKKGNWVFVGCDN